MFFSDPTILLLRSLVSSKGEPIETRLMAKDLLSDMMLDFKLSESFEFVFRISLNLSKRLLEKSDKKRSIY